MKPEGGVAILSGTLAPNGAVAKIAGLGDDHLKKRLIAWRPPQSRFTKGLLARISKTMLPVEKGAILQRDF